ncbi:MFS transporter [Nitrospira moscoviensis]|uniref:Putative Sugar transporter of the major facilitator superfamily n=1 Tax=Nitrospira moscoviensis TaxID=42253 RepID=A0A0K2GFB6_NITMO|nr:MFS transporter [Nitrospira moscoviensis]ALA59646.1 putative Sugar transporter of the major facilitator superfamily [Nitrospira moscoviensis]
MRWLILTLLFCISVVTYIDRVNISVTARQMMPAFGLTDQEMGWIFSAFVTGYALFQIPGGWLADRWGARAVLTGALVWWSLCTAFTAMAAVSPLAEAVGIVGALLAVRFTLGMGEAVALPTFNRAVANWMPAGSRGIGIGIAIGGIGLGSAVTPPIAAWIMVNWGWQTVFYLSAVIGLAMAVLWWAIARNHPREHPWVRRPPAPEASPQAADSQFHTLWRLLAGNRTVWWLVLSYSCLGYAAYFYMSWFYLYLVTVRGFDVLTGGLYASAPFLAMLIGCPVGGWVTDRLAARYGITAGRASTGMAGMTAAGVAIAFGGFVESPPAALAGLSLGAGCLYFTVGAYWASTTDLSKAHAGTLSGLMNTGANLGGALSPVLTPWIAAHWGWPASFAVAGLVALAGAALWWWIDPGKGLNSVTRDQ